MPTKYPFVLQTSNGKNNLEEMRIPQHRATQVLNTADA